MVAVGTVTVGGVQGGFAETPLILLKKPEMAYFDSEIINDQASKEEKKGKKGKKGERKGGGKRREREREKEEMSEISKHRWGSVHNLFLSCIPPHFVYI